MTTTAPVTLITGAGSGIGRATALLLARSGHRLVLVGRRRDALDETLAQLPDLGAAVVLPADVSDPAAAAAAVTHAIERFDRLDALVNNAGYAPLLPIDKTTPEELQKIYAVNALGPAYTIAAAWPVFTRQKGGCIVNISTLGTIDPFPGFFGYAAAKAAVNLMAKSCAKEGKRHNIRAFAIAPGAVETEMLRANFPETVLPRARCMQPEDIAQLVADCIAGARDGQNGETIVASK